MPRKQRPRRSPAETGEFLDRITEAAAPEAVVDTPEPAPSPQDQVVEPPAPSGIVVRTYDQKLRIVHRCC